METWFSLEPSFFTTMKHPNFHSFILSFFLQTSEKVMIVFVNILRFVLIFFLMFVELWNFERICDVSIFFFDHLQLSTSLRYTSITLISFSIIFENYFFGVVPQLLTIVCWMQEEKILQVTSFNKSSITIPISQHSKVCLSFGVDCQYSLSHSVSDHRSSFRVHTFLSVFHF